MTLNYRPDISSKIKQLVGMAPTITAQGYYRLAGGLSLIGWDVRL